MRFNYVNEHGRREFDALSYWKHYTPHVVGAWFLLFYVLGFLAWRQNQ